MDATSDTASGSASTAANAASTLYPYTTHLDWGSKGFTFFIIISNDGLWLYGFAIIFNVGSVSQIMLIVSDPSANIFNGSSICGLTVW